MRKPCSVEGCGRPSHGHGWCTSHLYRWRKFGDVMADLSVKHRGMPPKDVLTRLMARRRIEDDCWVFTGRLQSEGYGTIFRDGRTQYAHRVAYELFVGPIPDGLHIDHLCRNRACFNPDHLEPVTCKENLNRGNSPSVVTARSGVCIRGHERTEENLYTRPDGRGLQCRECTRIRARERYWALKAMERAS